MNCCTHKTSRWTEAAGSVIPGAIALLLPKCPLCIAAWVAAGTGFAVPTMLADSVRPVLAVLCAVSVFLLCSGLPTHGRDPISSLLQKSKRRAPFRSSPPIA